MDKDLNELTGTETWAILVGESGVPRALGILQALLRFGNINAVQAEAVSEAIRAIQFQQISDSESETDSESE